MDAGISTILAALIAAVAAIIAAFISSKRQDPTIASVPKPSIEDNSNYNQPIKGNFVSKFIPFLIGIIVSLLFTVLGNIQWGVNLYMNDTDGRYLVPALSIAIAVFISPVFSNNHGRMFYALVGTIFGLLTFGWVGYHINF